MLDRFILKTDYGVSYGSVTLKSLQNDNVPELDLLVREAIQNSSDAALKEDGDSYSVNFLSGKFIPKQLNSFLTGIENFLNGKFPNDLADFLEIRDTKTSGLSGNIRKADIKKDDHGNYFKLIYDTGKRQTISTAGGNWGFGKSVYYRVGIGIVIFYSRIKNWNQEYEDRLIITLVEDEGKVDSNGIDASILGKLEPLSAGKAWWGIKSEDSDDLLPLQDTELIQPILDVFKIKPFKEKETGTSVIIPYLRTDELLEGIIPVESDIRQDVKEHFKNVWISSVSDYLRLAIQKWYSPKIHNRELIGICKKKWLLVSVDNVPIKKQDMLPFFRLAQELYTTALGKSYNYDYESREFPGIVALPVNVRAYFDSGTTSGYVAVIRISKDILNGNENVLSPYDYIGKFEADGGLNEPIVMFARDPGMIIDFALTGPWVKNLTPPDNENEFIFAFYVPTTEKIIKKDFKEPKYAGMALGEYLRECEASDHMEWNDPVKMKIVERIQKNTVNAILSHEKNNTLNSIESTTSKLANKLGKLLLPKIGYGKKISPGGRGGSGGGVGTKDIILSIDSMTIKEKEAEVEFELKLSRGKHEVFLSVIIASEAGWIDAKSWKEEIGTEFPVVISGCEIKEIKILESDICCRVNSSISLEYEESDTDLVSIDLISETSDKSLTKLHITSHSNISEIKGIIRISAYDKKYQFALSPE